jgi:type III secretory pathway component EscV
MVEIERGTQKNTMLALFFVLILAAMLIPVPTVVLDALCASTSRSAC